MGREPPRLDVGLQLGQGGAEADDDGVQIGMAHAAHQLLEKFSADPAGARESYLRCLKSGGSLDPIDALREAGVDMLSPEPVQATFRTLEGYVARLEELLQARRN